MLQFTTSIIGAVFAFTGLIKALNARLFYVQIKRLGVLPIRLVPLCLLLLIELECAVGSALLMNIAPEYTIPIAVVLLMVFSLVSLWGLWSRRMKTCGCYGNFFWMPVNYSIFLNIGYTALLILAWLSIPTIQSDVPLWKYGAVMLIIGLSGFMTKQSIRKPIWDFSVLKKGRNLNPKWFKHSDINLMKGSHFLAFLNLTCSECKRWVSVLDKTHLSALTFEVTCVFEKPGNPSDCEFVETQLQTHPFTHVFLEAGKFRFLASQLPVGILLQEGKIMNVWQFDFPLELLP